MKTWWPGWGVRSKFPRFRPYQTESAFDQTTPDRKFPWSDSSALDSFCALEGHSKLALIGLKRARQFVCARKELLSWSDPPAFELVSGKTQARSTVSLRSERPAFLISGYILMTFNKSYFMFHYAWANCKSLKYVDMSTNCCTAKFYYILDTKLDFKHAILTVKPDCVTLMNSLGKSIIFQEIGSKTCARNALWSKSF